MSTGTLLGKTAQYSGVKNAVQKSQQPDEPNITSRTSNSGLPVF